MSFRDDLPLPDRSPEDDSDNNHHPILEAYDELALARTNEIYLSALERYIYQNVSDFDVLRQILQFLSLYKAENSKGLDRVATILKTALAGNWGDDG